MNLKQPMCFLAIGVALIWSTATQAHAQNSEACEAFTAAIEAMGDATIVSGLTAEETVTNSFDDPSFLIGDIGSAFDADQPASSQTVETATPQLTLPTGTLTFRPVAADPPLRDVFGPQDVLSFGGSVAGEPTEFFLFTSGSGIEREFGLAFSTFVLELDSEQGDACGVCINDFGPELAGIGLSEINGPLLEIFDGDTLIASLGADDDLSFIAAPGQAITRIEFTEIFPSDIMVAFKDEPVVLPPVDVSSQQCLANIAAEVGALADAATDSKDAYALNVACAALNFAAKDNFFEEDGNRLTRRGSNVFVGAAYAICYLQHTGVEGTEDIVDRILDKLEQIVEDEIDYAINNGGRPEFIDRAEDLAELAQWIDEDLDNPVVATIAYKLAWANAFFSTY